MLQLLNILQLILYIGLLCLVGQGVLFLFVGTKGQDNLIWQLFEMANRPWTLLARWISPARVAERHHGFVAFCVVAVFYVGVTLAKIEYCISVQMVGCR